MAATVGNFSYSTAGTTPGFRQPSLMGKIMNISPMDYPMFTHTGNTRARDITHNWRTRLLPNRDFNGTNGGTDATRVEGATYSYLTTAPPTNIKNTSHILWHGVEVTGTAQAIAYYGIGKLLADQVSYRSEQHKGALERALIRSTEAPGNESTARAMDGLLAAITTNSVDGGGSALTEDLYIDMLKTVWEQGPKARHVLTNGSLRKQIDKFDAQGATKWIQSTTKEVVNMVLVYQSSFGTVQNMLSRDMEDGNGSAELVAIDFSFFKKAWLRPTTMQRPSLDGDYIRSVILSELTLEYGDERAAAKTSNLLNTA